MPWRPKRWSDPLMVLICLAMVGGSLLLGSRSGGGGKLSLSVQVDENSVAHARITTAAYPFVDESVRIRSVESDPAIELLTPRSELAAAFRKDSFNVELDLRFRVRDCRLLPLSSDPMVKVLLGDRWGSTWTFEFVLNGVAAAAPATEFVRPAGPVPRPGSAITVGPGVGPGPRPGPGGVRGSEVDDASPASGTLEETEIAALCGPNS